jgi:tetratricopeptide (TPR) repeat protein
MSVAVVAAVLAVPALAFALWPLLAGSRGRRTFLPVAPDAREPLVERKRQILRALRELQFEHEAGHVSDEDHAELRARYEAEAAEILAELDRLGPAPPAPEPEAPSAGVRPARGWRHPLALGTLGVALLVFGIALGVGIVRYTEPDPLAGLPMPGSRPLASLEPAGRGPGAAGGAATAPAPGGPPRAGEAAAGPGGPRPLAPEMLQGMLQAARSSLFAGRYSEAIAAYRAVLDRDPRNVDALTHLGLIVAFGGQGDGSPELTDHALQLFDRALALDPAYPPALLYRGQVLYESRRDVDGAIRSWEQFLAVVPEGEDRQRVQKMIAEARARR